MPFHGVPPGLRAEVPNAPLKLREIDEVSVEYFLEQFAARVDGGATEVLIDINSPGGSVFAGLDIIEAFRASEAKGVRTVCRVDGMAASMGALILQSCTERQMTKRSTVMFHEPEIGGVGGKSHELRRWAQTLEDLGHYLAILASARLNITVAEYEDRVRDRELWLSWDEALRLGAVDLLVR